MKFTKLEQLTKDTVFFQERSYSGFVKFKVTSNDGFVVNVDSVSTTGYDFELSQDYLDSANERGKYLYDTKETALLGKRHQDEEQKDAYIEEYQNNKDAFVALVLKKAYLSAMDAEYGDYVEGSAIKELASIHFPDVEL